MVTIIDKGDIASGLTVEFRAPTLIPSLMVPF
jgi:hypothetical protein